MDKIYQKTNLLRKNPTNRENDGFTLIELLIVVLIIGILAAIALPQYERAVFKARAANDFVLLRSLKDAQDRYYMGNGKYAEAFDILDIEIPAPDKVAADGGMDGRWPGETAYYDDYRMFVLSSRGFVFVQRFLSPSESVWLGMRFSQSPQWVGDVICGAASDKGNALCKSLGGTRVVNDGSMDYYSLNI